MFFTYNLYTNDLILELNYDDMASIKNANKYAVDIKSILTFLLCILK